MFCSKCGTEIIWDSECCSKCGTSTKRESFNKHVAVQVTKSNFFSMDGRINRLKFFLFNFAIMFVVNFSYGFYVGMMGVHEIITVVIALIFSIIISAFQIVKRFHDLDRPGTHYWLLLIPFYGIYLAFVLLFACGTDGTNRYGSDPLENN